MSKLVKCNYSGKCSFHAKENCVHGEIHEEKAYCAQHGCCHNTTTVVCNPISSKDTKLVSFELEDKPITEKKKVYVQQHGIVSSNSLLDLMLSLNKHAKLLHKFQLIVVVSDDNYQYNAIYSHHLLIKK